MKDARRTVASPEAKRLGAEIRRQREAKGLSMSRLADEIRLDKSSMSLIERGHQEPRFDHLRRIARVLRVTPADLVRAADAHRS